MIGYDWDHWWIPMYEFILYSNPFKFGSIVKLLIEVTTAPSACVGDAQKTQALSEQLQSNFRATSEQFVISINAAYIKQTYISWILETERDRERKKGQ